MSKINKFCSSPGLFFRDYFLKKHPLPTEKALAVGKVKAKKRVSVSNLSSVKANPQTCINAEASTPDVGVSPGSGGGRARYFRAYLTAIQLLELLHQTHGEAKVRMLDVGGAHGIHARYFRRKGIDVDIVDVAAGDETPTFIGDYLDYPVVHPYDVIWSSHVLEHVPNVGLFLNKMYQDLKAGGYLACTVPPLREHRMAFGHLSFWNPGLLLLNAALAGFDPRTAHLAKFGYNVSLIIQKPQTARSTTSRALRESFPQTMRVSDVHFRGDIARSRWSINKEKILKSDSSFTEDDVEGKKTIFYYDDSTNSYYKCA